MDEEPASYHQRIHAENGAAYGVAGADLHVWGDGAPLYLLESWRDAPGADPDWLRGLPGRLLSVRDGTADRTGPAAGLSELHEWRRGEARLAARWLYGPGAAATTRLAARFASESADDNWKVVAGTRAPGGTLPALDRQDFSLGAVDGMLLVIDQADRWPWSSLAHLLSSTLFRRPDGRTRTRILLTGSTLDGWPDIRHELSGRQAATSSQRLEPHERDDQRQAPGDRAFREARHGRE